MKRKNKNRIVHLLLILLMSMILGGCSFGYEDLRAGVVTPSGGEISIGGQYKFKEVMSIEEGKFVDESNFGDFTADFSTDRARIGLEILDEANYQSKMVNTFDYFLEKYRANPNRLDLLSESLEVVTIRSEDRTFYDVFKIDDDNIVIVKGNNLIKLVKTVLETSPSNVVSEGGPDLGALEDIVEEPRAGVLIGLRGERDEITNASSYRTLWITNDGEVQEVYEIEDILFPRKEFWKVEIKREAIGGETLERLSIYPVLKANENDLSEKSEVSSAGKFVELDFVGNNFIGIRTSNDAYSSHEAMPYTKTLEIDKYTAYEGVGLEEVSGQEGVTAFMNSLDQAKMKNEKLDSLEIDLESFLHSFYLNRNRGRWMMVSRVNATTEGKETFYDIPIAMKPSSSLITYDELTITWDKIIDKVPQAIDAFNAPGNSFLLIRTPKYLMMYRIEGENLLSEKPLQMVEIKETDDIIMAEWARGDFVKRWTDVALKLGTKIIFVQTKK